MNNISFVPHNLSEQAVSNYRKLLEFLESGAVTDDVFNMREYCQDLQADLSDEKRLLNYNAATMKPLCGTVRCLLGLAVIALKAEPFATSLADHISDWELFYDNNFRPQHLKNTVEDDFVFEWVFSWRWSGVDNTLAGGINRIRLMLDSGLCPASDCPAYKSFYSSNEYAECLEKLRKTAKTNIFNDSYMAWQQACLLEYNEKFGEKRKYFCFPDVYPDDYCPSQLVEFSEDGTAYPHSPAGTNYIRNAVTPWKDSPHFVV